MKYDHISFCGPLCKMLILASATLSKVKNSTPKRYLKSSTRVFMQISLGFDLLSAWRKIFRQLNFELLLLSS